MKISLKKSSLIGGFLFGATYTCVALFLHGLFPHQFTVLYHAGAGVLTGLAGAAIGACVHSITQYCQSGSDEREKIARTVVNYSNDEFLRGADTQTVIHSLTPTLEFNMRKHAFLCNQLVSDYSRALVRGNVNIAEYQEQAQKLKESWEEQERNIDYLSALNANGYVYARPPAEIIVPLPVVRDEKSNTAVRFNSISPSVVPTNCIVQISPPPLVIAQSQAVPAVPARRISK